MSAFWRCNRRLPVVSKGPSQTLGHGSRTLPHASSATGQFYPFLSPNPSTCPSKSAHGTGEPGIVMFLSANLPKDGAWHGRTGHGKCKHTGGSHLRPIRSSIQWGARSLHPMRVGMPRAPRQATFTLAQAKTPCMTSPTKKLAHTPHPGV